MKRLLRSIAKVFKGLLTVIIVLLVAAVVFSIYLGPRPSAKAIRPVSEVSVPAPFRLGSLSVIQRDAPDQYRALENTPTHCRGHFEAIDPVTHHILAAYFGSIAVYEAIIGSIKSVLFKGAVCFDNKTTAG